MVLVLVLKSFQKREIFELKLVKVNYKKKEKKKTPTDFISLRTFK